MQKICVVTGSRAEYGLLYHPMKAIEGCPEFRLQLAVTGMHLSPEFGSTVSVIEADGWTVDARVDMLLSSDSAVGVTKSVGVGLMGFADVLANLKPDLVMLLGDRFEMLSVATAALIQGIPIAHLCGGDVTEGAYDESIRHALTKMSSLHFVTSERARQRVVQLGEEPDRVHVVGNPGLDHLAKAPLLERAQVAERLSIPVEAPWALFTFHPVTRDDRPSEVQLEAALAGLEDLLARGFAVIVTAPNADNGGRGLNTRLREWVGANPGTSMFASLGQALYLGTMRAARLVIGNSSSGLFEAPSFKIPTVNIGSRQDGRDRAVSVIDCEPEADSIRAAIAKALALDCSEVVNPYGSGHASEAIVEHLKAVPSFADLVRKRFYDLPAGA